jgi:hypothetical protein
MSEQKGVALTRRGVLAGCIAGGWQHRADQRPGAGGGTGNQ